MADYCAVYKRASEVNDDSLADNAEIRHEGAMTAPLAPSVSELVAGSAHEAQTLVPIYTGEFVEKVKFVVPTLVRLQLVDSCSYLRVHCPNLMHPGSGVVSARGVSVGLLEGLAIVADGEANGPLSGFAGALRGEPPSEVIEGGSHILKRVPDNEAERRLLEHLSVEDVLATVRIGFMDHSIWFSGAEGGKFVAENFKVVACPTELEAGSRE